MNYHDTYFTGRVLKASTLFHIDDSYIHGYSP